jgi:putative transcriptional regulator
MSYRFEWDVEKARANWAKHRVDFNDAQRIFDDPFAIDWIDDRENYGEERFAALGIVEGPSCSLPSPCRTTPRFASSPPGEECPMRNADTTKARRRRPAKPTRAKTDWRAFDAMTDEEVEAAARSDPDAQPLTDADMKRMKRTPQVKIIRRALKLSQEEFAKQFRIPIGTLRDWEQGRVEPDQAARAYLKVIARNPKAVREALEPAA